MVTTCVELNITQRAKRLSSAVTQSLRRSDGALTAGGTGGQACACRDNSLYIALFIQKLLSNLNRRSITSRGEELGSTGVVELSNSRARRASQVLPAPHPAPLPLNTVSHQHSSLYYLILKMNQSSNTQ